MEQEKRRTPKSVITGLIAALTSRTMVIVMLIAALSVTACGSDIEPTKGTAVENGTRTPVQTAQNPSDAPAATVTARDSRSGEDGGDGGTRPTLPTATSTGTPPSTTPPGGDRFTQTPPSTIPPGGDRSTGTPSATATPTPAGALTADSRSTEDTPFRTAHEAETLKGRYGLHPRRTPERAARRPERRVEAPEAGEIDDNAEWETYQAYAAKYDGPRVHRTEISRRLIIRVVDDQDLPVRNAVVRIQHPRSNEVLQESLTYADGRTLFHPERHQADEDLRVTATKNGASASSSTGDDWTSQELALRLQNDGEPERTPLDVLFLLDSTGSMADEIRQIQTSLVSISRKVAELDSPTDLRFGMVTYRDYDDRYVTKFYPFSNNVRRFAGDIREIRAKGGGDYPEALNEAFNKALKEPGWRGGAVRLIFLVADAPPHMDGQSQYRYDQDMEKAREEGIKVFAVASSGLDGRGEYIFRQIAQQTMGRFIFLLYDTAAEQEQARLTTPHDVGDNYSVEDLDDLIVRLIEEELKSVTTEYSQAPRSDGRS